jgi:hypothetical protein
LEVGRNLIVGGGSLWCDSLGRGELSLIGSGVAEQAVWGVETKSREIEVEVEPSPHSRSTEETLWKRVVVPHRIFFYVLATLAHYEGCSVLSS